MVFILNKNIIFVNIYNYFKLINIILYINKKLILMDDVLKPRELRGKDS